MTPLIITASTPYDLAQAAIAAGVLIPTETGFSPASGVVYSFMGTFSGVSCAMVDLTGCTPELQTTASAALQSLANAPGTPARMVLGGTPSVRSVSPASWRLALMEAGLYDAANAIIAQAPKSAQVVYEFSNKVLRNHPLLPQMAQAMGKTEADIEAVFLRAEQLDRA